MLHEFLIKERHAILALCAHKLSQVDEAQSSSIEMDRALPVFYNELIEVLREDEEHNLTEDNDHASPGIHQASAVRSGKESLRLGYTISQVVRGYGVLCQAITEYLGELREPINPREFNRLNLCLDIAIAAAVTEFSRGQNVSSSEAEVTRLGFLAHEMRNALHTAATAHQLMKKGIVGVGGSTSKILEQALIRMKDIIDRSLSEVRLQGEPTVELRRLRVIALVGEVEATAALEADAKSIGFNIQVAPDLEIEADHHLVVSALSNLVQNAIKYTKPNGLVSIRSRVIGDRVLIDVEDQCGGLPPGKVEELFAPFTQKGTDRSGLGLGLSIARRAISLNSGVVSARDLPGKGCIFTIDLPLSRSATF